ncbi:MAG: hypothetical protein CBE01_002220 [Planctomycetaceae bacterium TMED241]|jgi:hypothetical protein|nr:MAG: hypothetical protein CBE01_002220 [Planctomycetaceae bacterium TMED241]
MGRSRRLTLAGWISLMITTLPAAAEPSREARTTRCDINAMAQACEVLQTPDTLELSLEDGRTIAARRLGRWRSSGKGATAVDSCNVKITLQNDTAYGLLVRSAEQGTTLTWPQLQIGMPELRP